MQNSTEEPTFREPTFREPSSISACQQSEPEATLDSGWHSLSVGVAYLASRRISAAFKWILSHRNESAAVVVLAMMASTFVAQNHRHRSTSAGRGNSDLIAFEQLLHQFSPQPGSPDSPGPTGAEMQRAEMQRAEMPGTGVAANTVFAIRTSTDSRAESSQDDEAHGTSGSAAIRISRSMQPAITGGPQDNRTNGKFSGVRFRGHIEPMQPDRQ